MRVPILRGSALGVIGAVLLGGIIAGRILCAQTTAEAKQNRTAMPYPSMAPLDQYLMDRKAEIALARTAAPEAISGKAKILVLTQHGYETAVEGTNGFVCVVERGWMSPFDSPEFWNPKIRGPICFNPAAARSVFPLTIKRTELILAGQTKAHMLETLKAALNRKELPALESGAMSYMMSKEAYLTDSDDHNMSHLMIYAALTDGASWGADLRGSPVLFAGQFQGKPEPITVFLIPVGTWSDGTPAPSMQGGGESRVRSSDLPIVADGHTGAGSGRK